MAKLRIGQLEAILEQKHPDLINNIFAAVDEDTNIYEAVLRILVERNI